MAYSKNGVWKQAKRDLYMRPITETYKRDLQQRPIKETYKIDL